MKEAAGQRRRSRRCRCARRSPSSGVALDHSARDDAVAEADRVDRCRTPAPSRGCSSRIDGPSAIDLAVVPRPERVAERVHVGVRADPRVAEQVPGAADRVARLEDRVALVRAVAAGGRRRRCRTARRRRSARRGAREWYACVPWRDHTPCPALCTSDNRHAYPLTVGTCCENIVLRLPLIATTRVRGRGSWSTFSLMEFMRDYPDDAACLEHLWRPRYSPDGEHADCPKCKQERVFRKYATAQGRQSWTCTGCGHHVHPTAGHDLPQVLHVAAPVVLRHLHDDKHSLRRVGQDA